MPLRASPKVNGIWPMAMIGKRPGMIAGVDVGGCRQCRPAPCRSGQERLAELLGGKDGDFDRSRVESLAMSSAHALAAPVRGLRRRDPKRESRGRPPFRQRTAGPSPRPKMKCESAGRARRRPRSGEEGVAGCGPSRHVSPRGREKIHGCLDHLARRWRRSSRRADVLLAAAAASGLVQQQQQRQRAPATVPRCFGRPNCARGWRCERRAEVRAIGLLARVDGGIAPKEIKRLLTNSKSATVADGADRPGAGETPDKPGRSPRPFRRQARSRRISDEPSALSQANQALIKNGLAGEAIADEPRQTQDWRNPE